MPRLSRVRRSKVSLLAAWALLIAVVAGLTDWRPSGAGFRWSGLPAAQAADGANPFPERIPSPSLEGGAAWINTAGPIDLKQLRGKFVVLDFWTYCCINCMHILPELKKLEQAYPNEIVVIGVHSAKFDAEQDSKNITDAVMRYEIEHPVINDSRHRLWDKFEVTSWPSLRVIDPEGYVIGGKSGEVTFEELDKFFKKAIPYYRRQGLLDETPLHFELAAQKAKETPLRYPGKVLADSASKRLFIADSNHNRIVVTQLDGTLLETIGSGAAGSVDGDFKTARFDRPQGMALDGQTLYVADTENHQIRKVDLKQRQVTTLAGTGKQAHQAQRGLTKPLKSLLSSPWALWLHGKDLFIAMAGPHQIWKMQLPHGDVGPYAGNGREDIVDGPRLPAAPYEEGYASFAQPSGLTSDGTWLYVADSEGSSIRAVPLEGSRPVNTVVGTAGRAGGRLFTFGDVDGQGSEVRLQHPLDVAWHDGKIYVADTYNNKIKVIDPGSGACQTVAGSLEPGHDDRPPQFDEPAGLSAAGNRLYVADTNNHAIRVIDLARNKVSTLTIAGLEPPEPPAPTAQSAFRGAVEVTRTEQRVKPSDNELRLHVQLQLPLGYEINPQAPMRYLVESTGANGPVERSALGKLTPIEERASDFEIALPLASPQGKERLKISLGYYYCQDAKGGLCKSGAVAWTVPIEIDPKAKQTQVDLKHKVE